MKLPLVTCLAVVLAHQGGWDEALMVAAPIGLFVILLRVANARAKAAEEQDPDLRSDPDDDDPDREDPH